MPRRPKLALFPGLQAIVTVEHGLADVIFKPPGLSLTIFDYDVEGFDPDEPGIARDPSGQPCFIQQWEPTSIVVSPEKWAILRKAVKGDYSRTWKCPDCGRQIDVSYQQLAEVGSPICPRCDLEMELQ